MSIVGIKVYFIKYTLGNYLNCKLLKMEDIIVLKMGDNGLTKNDRICIIDR